jgi:hypothetical protein
MAAGASVTWTHCSVRFEVTWGKTVRVRADALASAPWMPRDYIRGPQTFHSHFLRRLGLEKLRCILVHFVVWAAIGGPFWVILVVVLQIKFFSTQPFEDYFKVVAA